MSNVLDGNVADTGLLKGGISAIYGKDGYSAYEIAVKNGFEGTEAEWLASLKGKQGDPGYTPQKGIDYFDGEVGRAFTYEDFTPEQLAALKGKDGYTPQKGVDYFDGDNGISPTVSVNKSGKTTTIEITDKSGKKTVAINDGADGTMTFEDLTDEQKATLKGEDGYTPIKGVDYFDGTSVTVSKVSESTASGGTNTVTFSDGKRVNIKNGKDGENGHSGVYVGSGNMPEGYFVQIDPNGEAFIAPHVNVKNFGAVGDGETDDTDAIRAARDAAVAEKKPLYFPSGTYMVHGSIELWSDCEIYGEGSKSVIKKIPAITEVLKPKETTGSFYRGQTTFTVADGSRYTVGHDCYIGYNHQTSDQGVYCVIESIDGNNVTIKSFPNTIVNGVLQTGLYNLADMNKTNVETILTTSFPVLCSYRCKADGSLNNLRNVYIHDIEIDGNRQEGEGNTYYLSTINITLTDYTTTDYEKISVTPNENIRLENLNLRNSPADGISAQSVKNVCITNCITENCSYNGVHVGVGSTNVSIIGCKLNADYCGYYDCAGVSSATLSNNHFEKCLYGIGGLDQNTRGATISGNTFRGCGVGVFAGSAPYPQNITDDLPTKILTGAARAGVTICNNTFYGVDFTGVGVSLTCGRHFIVSGNIFRFLDVAIETGGTKHARISDNLIKDCATVLSMNVNSAYTNVFAENTYNSAFVGNMIHAEANGASSSVTIENAESMLVSGNIITGAGAVLNVDTDTTTGVIAENNIVAV